MDSQEHKTIYRKDYKPSPYLIESVHLEFQLDPERSRVTATSKVYRNNNFPEVPDALILDGEELELLEVSINDRRLTENEYAIVDKKLAIYNPPTEFTLCITTQINPQQNKALSGLYRSSGNFCTQCEAEGFRRITYYLDRPDVLAKFTTRIEASKDDCPVLLANGNLLEEGDLGEGNHYAVWEDPFPKPCYLFALVAGNLVATQDSFVTRSGRKVSLYIYVEPRNSEKCSHAMTSLKNAMRWDEEVYGLEYDLERYMIVAVDDFNMGAMENKGLNIFNSKYVLALPESATDQDFLGIEGVIAHEYFHNWTGNRVTCRDWFQLSLKEGLTVFRDQEFSADMNSRPVQRIKDVNVLRSAQFREDAGPMAHPVRPDAYVEINNFYTLTVYNKGAEVVRMLQKVVGTESFYKGMRLYFERFDGMAVTCDDFVQAMADASGMELSQFKLWYSQAGTPELEVEELWDQERGRYTLNITQSCPSTPGQKEKKPFLIPIDIALLNHPGPEGEKRGGKITEQQHCLELRDTAQSFEFNGLESKPVLSFLRDFSAPVKVKPFQSRDELAFLMARDGNLFNRWESAFQLSVQVILEVMTELAEGRQPILDHGYLAAFTACLTCNQDLALNAEAITLPSETYMAQFLNEVEPERLFEAILFVRQTLAQELKKEFREVYIRCNGDHAHFLASEAMAQRRLKNTCLQYLMTPGVVDDSGMSLCLKQFEKNANMTDVVAALSALTHFDSPVKEQAFAKFYRRWQNDPLVVDKWLMLQAVSSHQSTLAKVKDLLEHEAFSPENPNKVRSLIGGFCSMNHLRFHDTSGAGYRFLIKQVIGIDKINPQIAARLLTPMTSYKKYTQKLRVLMEEQLRFLLMQPKLSADVHEIVQKSLDN